MLKRILEESLFPIVTPFIAEKWRELLIEAGSYDRFADVPKGITSGFRLGISSSLDNVFMPRNHNSALSNPDIVDDYIATEIAAGRFSQPFLPNDLEQLVGPFRTGPLGVVFNGKPRVVLDHSYPRNNPCIKSINSEIDNSSFQCDWTTFLDCFLRVSEAPAGTQVAVFDVETAHRRCPSAPQDRLHVCVHWRGRVYIDHCCCFGCSSSCGIFGRLADAASTIFLHRGVDEVSNWADDFNFWRFPKIPSLDGPWTYNYDEQLPIRVATEIGWPWSAKKSKPFSQIWEFIGFRWDLVEKSVTLPETKKIKFLSKLSTCVAGNSLTRREVDSIIGSLNHIAPIIATSRTHLPSLYRFAARFRPTDSTFRKISVPTEVIDDVQWWTQQLSLPFCGIYIEVPPTPYTIQIYVDASTSWGIGLIIDGHWFAWKLIPGWKSDGRDIGWAEMVAIELAVMVLITMGHSNCHFVIHSDNQGVVGAFRAGMSRSSQQNSVLRRILMQYNDHKIFVSTKWVASEDNPADDPSRGVFPPASQQLDVACTIPYSLRPFVSAQLH